jgi:hypothetical protein
VIQLDQWRVADGPGIVFIDTFHFISPFLITEPEKIENLIFCHSRENGNQVVSIIYMLSGFPPARE